MSTVERYGSGYSVRYRYETETGEKKQMRVSGFHTKEEAWAAAKELKEKCLFGGTSSRRSSLNVWDTLPSISP